MGITATVITKSEPKRRHLEVQVKWLTADEVANGFGLDRLRQLLCFIQIVENIDIRDKKDHVLLSTAIGHPDKILEVLHCRA